MTQDANDSRAKSRFVVGIDLGTTNSAVTFIDTSASATNVRTFAVPQIVAPAQVEARQTLPSFHYEPAEGELGDGAIRLPFGTKESAYCVGVFARDQGTAVPARLIASAKSWLCHAGVDRTADLLPWHGAADVEKLSPVEVAARYLGHVREAWDARFGEDPLAEQDVVVTLPASFDEVARELTVKAAARAGLARVVLIEEPQAAFYAWIDAHADSWEDLVHPGQKILVCDIGGGTSDFTLIRVRSDASGKVRFHRVAVGDHLILGGDNLDLALARHLEQRLAEQPGQKPLEPRQWAVLVRSCRQAKETLLGPDAPDSLTVNLPTAGSRLIGGGTRIEVTRDEAAEWLVDGFFPRVDPDEKPRTHQSGFQEFGLPFAPDPGVTRYLAAFLSAHRDEPGVDVDESDAHDSARPDIVLFNGGVFESTQLQDRLLDVISAWFRTPEEPDWQPIVLRNDRLDLAVARGAAYYGMVRRGVGVRIAAGLARTYYVGVESDSPSAVTLVPAGIEPGSDIELTSRRFELRLSEPVEFPLFVSSTRLTDPAGEVVLIDREQMTPLPPIRTVLEGRKRGDVASISVTLQVRLTEIGTLELWCVEVDRRRRWRLEFDVRSATQTDIEASETTAEREGVLDESVWEGCVELLQETFAPGGKHKPEGLIKGLSRISRMSRNRWPTSLLRQMWETLMDMEPGRRKSQTHEARWLNLMGFSLRPGYGLAMDDWRVDQTWRALQGNLVHGSAMCRAEWWIFWRRIAGGLSAGQQKALAGPLSALARSSHRQMTTGKGRAEFKPASHEGAEIWRLLGSLERLPAAEKIELGGILVDLVGRRKMEPVRAGMIWALGRIGARQPLAGPLNTVVPPETAKRWVDNLLKLRLDEPSLPLTVMQLARCTQDRYRDLSEKHRAEIAEWLEGRDAPPHFLELVRRGGQLDATEQGLIFGESLPKGLRLMLESRL